MSARQSVSSIGRLSSRLSNLANEFAPLARWRFSGAAQDAKFVAEHKAGVATERNETQRSSLS